MAQNSGQPEPNQAETLTAAATLVSREGGVGGGGRVSLLQFLPEQLDETAYSRPSVPAKVSDSTPTTIRDARQSEPVPEHDRITISWKGITVKTAPKGLGKRRELSKGILKDVAGIAHPGALMAVMGASGAGKTSLLNILNFRTKTSPDLRICGSVMLNGHVADANDMAAISVFVQQEDIFVGALTCREHLQFHATLRMKKFSKMQRKTRVEEVLVETGLKRCENVRIGDSEEKGISGGEEKRLSFATEILCRPTLIFCDEPTSGLDSYMARGIVKLLKRYAGVGRTILCTIHQPSSELFALFDYICIMAEGKCAYIGTAEGCLRSFAEAGFPSPENYNPFDHYIFTLAVIPGREEKCRRQVGRVTASYRASQVYKEMIEELEHLKKYPPTDPFWREDNDVSGKSDMQADAKKNELLFPVSTRISIICDDFQETVQTNISITRHIRV